MDSSTLLSWNVQGLGGDKSRKVKGLFKQELSPQYVGKFDILLIPEHHLSHNRVAKIHKFLNGRWVYDGFRRMGRLERKRGLLLHVLKMGFFYCRQGFFTRRLCPMNVYAPN